MNYRKLDHSNAYIKIQKTMNTPSEIIRTQYRVQSYIQSTAKAVNQQKHIVIKQSKSALSVLRRFDALFYEP